jgi:GNAT superfamily N-acetyltransferase|uniref:GNAT family N-acetyltransferase n=1 Tax=Candidatus Planktophila sp. TaxID=2175601 RepID=UPI00404A414D
MSLKIREIEITDKDRWLELWSGYLVFYKASIPESQTDLTWRRLFDANFNMNGLVAELDGRVVGFTHFLFRPSTWAINNYCYLEDLYVDSDIRGKGVGRALINEVVERAQTKGSPRVYWTTQNNNSQARVLYDSFGYPSEFVQYRIPLN